MPGLSPVPGTRPTLDTVAPWVFVALWSTGFVGAHYAGDAGPFSFLAVRLVAAAAILAAVARARGEAWPVGRRAWADLGLAGLGVHAVYLSGVFWSIGNGLPAGLSSLIAGLHPVVTSVAARVALGERLTARQWAGVGLGFTGVAVVVGDKLSAGGAEASWPAVVAMGLSVVGMSAGTLWQRARNSAQPLLTGTAVQYLGSAAVLAVLAVTVEGWDVTVTPSFVFAEIWSVVVLSCGAVLLMNLLLARRAAARVSTLFFLTPALSAAAGPVLYGERLGWIALPGLAVSAVGVALTNRR